MEEVVVPVLPHLRCAPVSLRTLAKVFLFFKVQLFIDWGGAGEVTH